MAGVSSIPERIKEIAAAGESLRFLNVYRGLPVTYDGRILEVSEHVIMFAVNRYQSICIRLEGQTFIQSNLLPEVVRAKVVTVDPLASSVVLTDFEYKGTSIGRRMNVRVEPEHPIRVSLGVNQSYYGDLTEISIQGIAVVLYPPLYSAMVWNRGETIPIEFRLMDVVNKHMVPVKLPGFVRYATLDRKSGGYRMGLQFQTPDQETESLLSGYVAQRQADLLNELKVLSDQESNHTIFLHGE